MENWTEEDLVKLSVKELKVLAKKNNVNSNFKKAELVMALLNNPKGAADCGESVVSQTSRRMTRSRVSMWQPSTETSDNVNEARVKLPTYEDNLGLKDPVENKRIKRKRGKMADDMAGFDSSEMFPLVSSIQLASKPLVEITNKKHARVENNKLDDQLQSSDPTSKRSKKGKPQNKTNENASLAIENEVSPVVNPGLLMESNTHQDDCDSNNTFAVNKCESTALTSKRTKKSRPQNQTSDVLLPNIAIEREVCPVVKPVSSMESNEQGCDLNNTFLVEKESPSQDVNKKKRKRKQRENESVDEEKNISSCKQLHQQPEFTNKSYNGSETKIENQQSDTVRKSFTDKPRRGKKRKSDSMENQAPKGTFTLAPNALGTRKRNKGNEKEKAELVDTKIPLVNNFGPLDTNEHQPKSEEVIHHDDNLLSETETDKTEKGKNGKNKKRGFSRKDNNLKSQNSTETSSNSSVSLQRTSRENVPMPTFTNESTFSNESERGPVKKSLTNKHDNVNENTLEDTSIVQGETGQNVIEGPIRSSTFILSEPGVTEESGAMPVPVPKRSSTFILSNSDGRSPYRKSMRFSPRLDVEVKSSPSQKAAQLEKSIGQRIMNSSVKKGIAKTSHKNQGSSVKKTIVKSTKQGSIFKKSSAAKMPNFKKIHHQLFNNMESLSENKKRQQERAKQLLMSPLVPKCAVVSPRVNNLTCAERSPNRQGQTAKVKTPAASSPLATKLKTPGASRTPVVASRTPTVASRTTTIASRTPVVASRTPVVASRTPMVSRKPVTSVSSVNRFGFRRPVKKEEATNIISKKLPSVNMNTKKEQDRSVLKGVRMNKRFMLQMQMRQLGKQ